jgi:hypothetical protein
LTPKQKTIQYSRKKKMPIDYKLGKIYKLVNDMTDDIYIGSTCEPTLARRLAGHIHNYRSYKKGKGNYATSFKLFENSANVSIYLIESYPCDSKDELHAKEGHYIKTIDCVNKSIAGRSKKDRSKQYYEKNKNKAKQYYEDNKDKIKESRRRYYEDNKDKINQYIEKNKDKRKIQKKQYREQKKYYFTANHDCECGGHYKLSHKAHHMKTTKHQQFIKLMDFVKSDKEFYNAYISLQKIKNREIKELPTLC